MARAYSRTRPRPSVARPMPEGVASTRPQGRSRIRPPDRRASGVSAVMVERQADPDLGRPARHHRKATPMTAQILTSDRMAMQKPVAQVVDVSKTYGRGAQSVHALRNVTAAFT